MPNGVCSGYVILPPQSQPTPEVRSACVCVPGWMSVLAGAEIEWPLPGVSVSDWWVGLL